ncbi:MAG: monofunctional biosynthetic peptidoglycan transglycosylase [Smithellaceae bacterium]|nr:monofunctional biosynthetic peptidoglycan transglycosylase [Smithellaceae bacterium]
MFKRFLILALALLVLGFISPIALYLFYPSMSGLKEGVPEKTAFMKYREEQWREKGKNIRMVRHWTPLAAISPNLIRAVIIAEDDKFWQHEGFDYDAIRKALEKDIKKGKFKYGGSTISQQLAKNLFLSPAKTPARKLKEAILTWRLERNLSKKRLIELYLNVAEWGEGIFGVEAASRHYFGKNAHALTPREAARLAAILPNPRRYSPLGDSRYVEARAELIYQIMVKRNLVIPEFEELLGDSPRDLAPPTEPADQERDRREEPRPKSGPTEP